MPASTIVRVHRPVRETMHTPFQQRVLDIPRSKAAEAQTKTRLETASTNAAKLRVLGAGRALAKS